MTDEPSVPRILFIDDEPNFMRPVIEDYDELGVELVTATSIEEAKDFLGSGQAFDGVIADMMLPVGSDDRSFQGVRLAGPQLAKLIKQQQPDIPIVGISAFTDPTENDENSPFDFFINKGNFDRESEIWSRFHTKFIARKLSRSEEWVNNALSGDDLVLYETKPERFGIKHEEFLQQRQQIQLSVNENILRVLNGDMERLPDLSPREFEEVCAVALGRLGFDITLTAEGPDDGIDLIATSNESILRPVYLVQCKRNRIDRKVSIPILRELRSVVDERRANGGIVMTSSFFSSKAHAYAESYQYQMKLIDMLRLKSIIEG